MNALINQIRQHIANVISSIAFPVKGIVDTVDPDSMTCVVRYQPQNTLSPSLPISCVAVGRGYGVIAIPNVGDQVHISFENGNYQVGVVEGAIFDSTDAVPPTGMEPGGYYLIHKSGSFIKMTQDGKLNVNGEVDIDMTSPTINITCSAVANITAPVVNINSPEVNMGDLSALVPDLVFLMTGIAREIYNIHTHDLDLLHDITLEPNQQMDDTTLTVNVKAT